MFDQKISLVIRIILISIYIHSISAFFERIDDKPNETKRVSVRSDSNDVLNGIQWKRVDREFVTLGIISEFRNTVDEKLRFENQIIEETEIKESKGVFERRRSDRTARTRRMDSTVNKSLHFEQQLNSSSVDKPKQIVQILRRIRRKAEKRIVKEDKKKKKENKDQSMSDQIMEMASQTLKDGLRKGVQLWNKLKTQITDSYNSLKSNDD